jgi:hypothetical protein
VFRDNFTVILFVTLGLLPEERNVCVSMLIMSENKVVMTLLAPSKEFDSNARR